jgi:putative DNA primase/helicase
LTGPESGLFDVDVEEEGLVDLAALEEANGPLPLTPRAASGHGGLHILFDWPAPPLVVTTGSHLNKLPIDTRGRGGQFVAPPSVNLGGPYRWLVSPADVPLAEAPDWLLAWLEANGRLEGRNPASNGRAWTFRAGSSAEWSAERRAVAYLGAIPPAVSGQGGHDQTFRAARAVVYGFELGVEAGLRLLLTEYNPRCSPPWSEKDLRHKAEDADSKPFGKPRGYLLNAERDGRPAPSRSATDSQGESRPAGGSAVEDEDPHLTDLGNAQRLVALHGQDLRYCHLWGAWLVWDGRRWALDETAEALRRVKGAQREFFKAAVTEWERTHSDEAKAALRHALQWEDARRINACLTLAQSERGVPILPAQMDSDPWLLNVNNGTLDLRTGNLRSHCRADLITKLAPVAFDADAECPLWHRVLDRLMDGNKALMRYLQRVIGYSLTGNVGEQCLWFLYGSGANGKSTFLTVIRELLGDYALQAVPELLMAKNTESHPTERADLFGRRFVATIETDEGKRLAESLMKQLTGGDNVRARRMRQDFFEFKPTWKLLLAANHKPTVRGCDHAVWRRIKLVPFTVVIPDAEKDKDLPAKLQTEWPGILRWALQGCLDWQREGLAEPDEVRQATHAYQAEQDLISGFIKECCQLHRDLRASASSLFDAYTNWSGDHTTTQKAFGQRLKERGFETARGHGGRIFYCEIGLQCADPGEGFEGFPG